MNKGALMKKLILLFAVLSMTRYVHASPPPSIVWSNSVPIYDWLGGLVPTNSSWIVRLYESADATINFSNLVPTGDDSYAGYQFTFASSGLAAGFSTNKFSNVYNISEGDKIYSVIFNSTDALTATRWAVIDGTNASTAAFSLSTFNYNPGGVAAGDWQAVPEPATALLFGIGGFGAWLIRRNKKLKAQEDIND
jgi:hypothetical protein